jgi:DNA-nicking Smr family endonuclease
LLGEEERALWRQVASSVEPLGRAKRVPDAETPDVTPAGENGRRHDAPAAETKLSGGTAEPPARNRSGKPGGTILRPTPPAGAVRAKPASPTPAASVIDKRKARRIARGVIEIEARLDLHGLTQREAHDRLAGFLAQSFAAGLRMVLVITGKGARARSELLRLEDAMDRGEQGVLRRNVPRWLAEPRLSAFVAGWGPASQRHGGDGALYVQLRRRVTGRAGAGN